MDLPQRKWLRHNAPDWVNAGQADYFVTICCQNRDQTDLTATRQSEKLIQSVARGHEQGDWWMHLFLIMPDHVHAILAIPDSGKPLVEIIRDWKRLTARTVGISWQRGFFDHRLRSDQAFAEKFAYVEANPIRQNLCATPADWPHRWPPHPKR